MLFKQNQKLSVDQKYLKNVVPLLENGKDDDLIQDGLLRSSIRTLMPGKWLNDEVINKYRILVKSNHSIVFGTFAFSVIQEGNSVKMRRIMSKALPKNS